ncbi:MAG: glycosyltransferase [Anaerolineales bacterium]|nr:glycosyltransferase [Anaerolineales bacterium]
MTCEVGLQPENISEGKEGELPSFSLIIPTYNRPEPLALCLQACAQLDYPCERLELIVVNDGGERPLTNLIAPFREKIDIRLVNQTNQGPATARNAGAAVAEGEYLAFTDDDCAPDTGWLRFLAQGFARETAVALGGHTVNVLRNNLFATASQQLVDFLYAYFNRPAATFFTSNNFAIARTLFLEVGGFRHDMPLAAGEDREFCDRWRHGGNRLHYVPEAVVYHRHHLTARSFWRQHFNYGRGAWHFHQVRAQRKQQKVQIESFSFYRDLLLYPLAQQRTARAALQVGLLGVSQVANAVGFFYERRQSRIANDQ